MRPPTQNNPSVQSNPVQNNPVQNNTVQGKTGTVDEDSERPEAQPIRLAPLEETGLCPGCGLTLPCPRTDLAALADALGVEWPACQVEAAVR